MDYIKKVNNNINLNSPTLNSNSINKQNNKINNIELVDLTTNDNLSDVRYYFNNLIEDIKDRFDELFGKSDVWKKVFKSRWDNSVGILKKDISYGDKESNKYDIYLPKNNNKKKYGLIVFVHGGFFTFGDKESEQNLCEYFTSKGFVCASINYSLYSENNNVSINQMVDELHSGINSATDVAKQNGYNISNVTIEGESAGGTLSMLYAFKHEKDCPVPINAVINASGPSNLDPKSISPNVMKLYVDPALSKNQQYAKMVSIITGKEISEDMIISGEYNDYLKKYNPIDLVKESNVPIIFAYAPNDEIANYNNEVNYFTDVLREKNNNYSIIEFHNSDHGLSNDEDAVYKLQDTVLKYLKNS